MTTTAEEKIERRHRAMMQLVSYRQRQEALRKELPGLVSEAVEAGITKADVAMIIGIHRSTVYEILARQEAGK